MNPETRNLVAAISLSMAVLIGYQLLFVEPKKDIAQNDNIVKESNDSSNIPIPQNLDNGIVASDTTETKSSNKPVPRISMISKEVSGSISLKCARIDDITLTQYKETLEPESELIKLLLISFITISCLKEYNFFFSLNSPAVIINLKLSGVL